MSEAPSETLAAVNARASVRHGMLRLDDSERVYIVHDGTVDVFLAPLRNGEIDGNRIYLFTAPTGTVLFGALKGDDDGLALIATFTDANVTGLSARELQARMRDRTQGTPLLAGTDAWVRGLSAAIMRPLQGFEPVSTPLAAKQTLRVEAGACLSCSDGPLWLEIERGDVLYVQAESVADVGAEVTVLAHPFRVPLAAGAFVRPVVACSVRCVDSAAAWDEGWGFTAVTALNAIFLRLYDREQRRARKDEQRRLQQRTEADHHAANSAIAQLAAPLREHPAGLRHRAMATSRDPLFLACAAAIAQLGYSIAAPPRLDAARMTRFAALDAIARHNRLRTRRIRLEPKWWTSDVEPFLLLAGDEYKPVAVLPSGSGRYDLFDPVRGHTTKLDERAAAALSGPAYVFTVPFPARSLAVRDVGGNAVRWSGSDVAAVAGFTITGGILAMGVPIATGIMAGELIPTNNLPKLVEMTVALLLVTALSAWLRYAVQIAAVRIEGRTGTRLQAAVMERLLSLPATFFRAYTAGDLAKRALAIQAIEKGITDSVISSVVGAAFAVVSLALMFYYSVMLALVAFAIILLLLAITTLLGWLRIRCERELIWIGGQISGLLLPLVGGIQKIRLAGAEGRAFLRWAQLQGEYEQYLFKAEGYGVLSKLAGTIFPLVATTAVFAAVAYVLYGGARGYASDTMSLGQLLAFFAAFNQATAGIGGLATVALQLVMFKPLLAFAAPILQAIPEADLGRLDPGELSGTIELSHVTFRYRPELQPVLEDFNLAIGAGEYVAIVGPSGTGKSTLLRLLLGFDFPEAGTITLDGRDLKHLDLRALRRQFGVVLQGGRLMAGTLFENILGSHLDLDEEDAWRAAEHAGMADDIRAMPMGLRTMITEGSRMFSGGQVQRILIARALVAQPRILLLDEATSALDSTTQATITRTLASLTITRLVIAHRLSTVRQARQIVVLHGGRVAETGTYAELMANDGVFRRLAERQSLSPAA